MGMPCLVEASRPRKLRVCLVNTNSGYMNEQYRSGKLSVGRPPVIPIGLEYTALAARDHGFECQVIDLATILPPIMRNEYWMGSAEAGIAARHNRESKRREYLLEYLATNQPDVVGFSFRNLDLAVDYQRRKEETLSHYLLDLTSYVRTARQALQGKGKIVLGGAGFSIAAQLILDTVGADYGVVGASEAAFPELLARLDAGEEVAQKLIARQFDFGSASYARGSIGGINYREYLWRGAEGNVQTKRGCASTCGYCSYPLIEGRRIETRDPLLVVNEIEQLLGLGFSGIHFSDSVFNAPIEHAKAVLREMKRRKIGPDQISSWSSYHSPLYFDEEYVNLLVETEGYAKASGLFRFAGRLGLDGKVGEIDLFVESGSNRMLSALGKNYTVEDITRTVMLLNAAHLSVNLFFLLGGPGEDTQSIVETCETIKRLQPKRVFFQMGVRVYPGTPFARQYHGLLWQHEADLLAPVFIPYDPEKIENVVRNSLPDYDSYNRLSII